MAEESNADIQNAIRSATASIRSMIHQQQTESSRRGQPPPLSEDVEELRLRHRINPIETSPAQPLWITTSSHKIDASKVPLRALQRITLKDLRLEEATKGGYLTLRVLEPAKKVFGILTVVEDHKGNAVLFAVYNMTEDTNPNLNDILPIGTVFFLKEPYIKITSSNECLLRCDCPSDMIVLYKGHNFFPLVNGIRWRNAIDPNVVDPMFSDPVPTTAQEWKERGNTLFRAGKFEYATRCYLLSLQKLSGLDNVGDLEQVVLMNASAAYLQRGFFEKSLEFAEKILQKYPGNQKVLDRAGRCCYKLRKYEEAKKYFDECNTLYPDSEDIRNELQKAKDRLLEQTEGKFNIYKMFLTQSNQPRHKIDCADYIGPVKVIKIPGKGRGVVATEDIEPGTLLVVSKALVFNWPPEGTFQMQINHDNTTDNNSENSNIINIAPLAQMIAKNPNVFGSIVYDLNDGISPVIRSSTGLFCTPNTREEPIVDVQRLKGILTTNSFRGSNPRINVVDELQGGGLFALPSYFNHSCIPNANWQIFNDVMFIRAIQSIKANDEVFLSYVAWDKTFSERQSMFLKRGFQCGCKRCLQESEVSENIKSKREDIRLKHKKIVTQVKENLRTEQSVVPSFKLLIQELAETYVSSDEIILNTTLLRMYAFLAAYYVNDVPARFCKAIECFHSFLKVFGFDPQVMLNSIETRETLITSNVFLTDMMLDAVAGLIFIHQYNGQHIIRDKWIQILRTLENILTGGDSDVLRLKYSEIADLL